MAKSRVKIAEFPQSLDAADAFFGVPISGSRAVLAAVELPDVYDPAEKPLEELRRLCETARVEPVGEVTQRRAAPDPSLYIGRGKVTEIRELVQAFETRIVLFDNDLSPAQQRNLEKHLKV